MRLLLDTHAFLWYIASDPKLPRYASDVIRDKSNQVFLSVVSVWELLIKYQIGKLDLPEPPHGYIEEHRQAHRIETLVLESQAVARLVTLPSHHRDPFDRMLICQALHHELTLVSEDGQLRQYPVAVLSR